jgi:hypothetical protein
MAAMLLLFALSSTNRPDNAIPNPVRRPKRSEAKQQPQAGPQGERSE